jgi:hypothetical protein
MASSKKRAPASKKARGEVELGDDLDVLFTKPLREFTKARDDLAKSLRQAGDREGAARVKAMRRPSVSAWTLNQIARRYPQRMDALLEAGEQLREAQRGALETGGAKALRDASQAHRALVNELLRAAPSLLSEAGFSPGGGNMDRVRDSLLAAPTARKEDLERLERGRLTQELEPGDLSDVLGLMRGRPAPRPEEEPRAKPAAAAIEAPAKAEKPPAKAEKPKRKAAAKAQKAERKVVEQPQRKAKTTDREEKKRLAAEVRDEKKRLAAKARDEKKRLATEARDEKKRLAEEQREEKKRLTEARRERAEASREAARTAKVAERRSAEADRLMREAEEAEAAAKTARELARDAEREAKEAQKLAEEAARRLEAAEGNLEA